MAQLVHVLRSDQFDKEGLRFLLAQASNFEQRLASNSTELAGRHRGKILHTLFYEASTRTRDSFLYAAKLLGMDTIATDNAGAFSSAAKGERLEHTIRIISGYGVRKSIIVLRHPENDSAERAASVSAVPIINGGAGTGEHPTQALTDIFTIIKRRGTIAGKTIVIGGDLLRGRTARSLARLLCLYKPRLIMFVSPEELRMRGDVLAELRQANVLFHEVVDMRSVLPHADVVYWTRIQKERFVAGVELEEGTAQGYRIGVEEMNLLRPEAILMHPLPYVDEIAPELDTHRRAVYFQQAQWGMYVRMALIDGILTGDLKLI